MTKTTGLKSVVAACMLLAAATLHAEYEEEAGEAQKAAKPPLPLLRLNANGPVSTTSALVFAPDGNTLYAAGLDKAVYAWTRDDQGVFRFAPDKMLRIPMGPGIHGLIKTLAMSSDGRYLAVAGLAKGSHVAGFTEGGLMWPASTLSVKHRRETGTIYVFDLENQNPRKIIPLRGHVGAVVLLAFAPHVKGQDPVLVSASEEYDEKTGDQRGGVRVWNLNQPEKPIAGYFDLGTPSGRYIPRAIAALRMGDRAEALQVGIAWGENFLRVWDVAKNTATKLANTATVACGGVDNRFLLVSGHRIGNDGVRGWHLGLWKPPLNQNARPAKTERPLKGQNAPIGIATAAQANTAMVVCFIRPANDVGFFLADTQSLKRVSPNAPTIKFGDINHRPAYAISPRGNFVAVAGNVDRKILVYPVNRDRSLAKPQILEGLGEEFPIVRFFAKGDSLGLGLNRAGQNGPPELLFDMTAGKTTDNAGWKPAPSDAKAKFSATKGTQGNRETVVIDFEDNAIADRTIILPEKQQIQQLAVCPETENHPPLVGVIVGSLDFAESILRVYDAKTGQRLRQFSGHTDKVTSIAFSESGTLMASAGLDRTVRVWPLEDLKDHIGESGFLDNLALSDINGAATVKKIDEFAAQDIRDNLKEGDVIEALTTPDKKTVKTSQAENFFYYLSSITPGQTVELQVRRNGQPLNANPKITVQQAVDERKPLFTLFFNKGQVAKDWSWIGWTPTGPFDSSDEQIEKLVGWHFNPADPNAPSTFAEIGEYRKDHYKKGLLKTLIEPAQPPIVIPPVVPPVKPPLPPPPPKLSLFIQQEFQQIAGVGVYETLKPDSEQRIWAKTKQLKAVLTVTDSDLPSSEIKDRLVWELGKEPQKLEVVEPNPRLYEVDLSSYDWQPKEDNEPYLLRVSFISEDPDLPPNFREQWIVFAPPPPPPPPPKKLLPLPTIVVPDPLTVLYDHASQPEIAIAVELEKAKEGVVQPGQLEYVLNGQPVQRNGQTLTKPFDEKLSRIEETLALNNGMNRIRVRLKSSESDQTELSDEVVVHYRRPPRVETIQAKAEVKNPRAEVTCTIRTPADLPILQWLVLVNNKMYDIPQNQITSKPNQNDKALTDVTLKNVLLTEGVNTIRLILRNADGRVQSTPKTQVRWVKYIPPQGPPPSRPKIYFANVNDQVPLAGYWPGDEMNVAFNVLAGANLQWVKVYYNGKQVATPQLPQPVDGMKYRFTLPVTLENDENDLRVVVLDKNLRWNEKRVLLRPLKPPVRMMIDQIEDRANNIVMKPKDPKQRRVEFPGGVGGPNIILRGRVITSESTMKLKRPYVKCWVNGYAQWTRANPVPGEPTQWRFAMNLVLNQKQNRLRLALPEAPQERFSQSQTTVACANPNTDQKLHLVVVGIDPKNPRAFDTNKLQELAEKAFGIGKDGKGPFQKPEVYVIPRNKVRSANVTAILKTIQVSKQNPSKGEHDLVVFFYQGQEVQKDDQIVLRTLDRVEDKDILTDQSLTELLDEIYGAHVVMLDVTHDQVKKVSKDWDTGEFLGLLRTVHNGGMPKSNAFPLISALQRELPKIKELDELPTAVKQAFENQNLNPVLDHRVPVDLKGTIVGPKP